MNRRALAGVTGLCVAILSGCAKPTPEEVSGNRLAFQIILIPMMLFVIPKIASFDLFASQEAKDRRRRIARIFIALLGCAFGVLDLGSGTSASPALSLFCVVIYAIFAIVSLAVHFDWPAKVRERSRVKAELRRRALDAKEQKAALAVRERKLKDAEAARQTELQKNLASRHRSTAVAVLDELLISASELGDGSEDKGVLNQMLRSSSILLAEPELAQTIASDAALKAALQQICDLIRQSGNEQAPVSSRLNQILAMRRR